MAKPIVREHNIETDEVIDREMTDTEYEFYLENQAKLAATLAVQEAKATEKAAILAKLGITDDEAKLLLS